MQRNQKIRHTKNRLHSKTDARIPFVEHFYELRRRLFYIAISILLFTLVAYSIQQHLVNILLAPAKGQHFIYTSPGGGLDFLFRVCVYTAIALSLPVIIYQFLKYIDPLLKDSSTSKFITIGTIFSGIFAAIGVVFGYFVGLPAVLHFLFHQFTSQQIQPLITAQSYIAFVTVYMLGSAMLLQIPLILVFINRITPLKPSSLFHKERWVILGAFVASGLMNPTPNLISQLMVAGPIIVMYQIGLIIIWQVNRHSLNSPKVKALLEQDAAVRAVRLKKARLLEPVELASSITAPSVFKSQLRSRPVVSRHIFATDIGRPSYRTVTPKNINDQYA